MAARLTTYLVVAIVAATLIAGWIVGAQRDDNSGPVDLIIHHATVYAADDSGTMAEAVAIRGNKILRVGSEREVMRHRRPQTQVIDAKGGAVLPGFNDAHVSLIDTGLALEGVDVSAAASTDEVQARVGEWAARHSDEAWIVGRGWSATALGEAPMTRAQLDLDGDTRPVLLLSSDGTTAWANTAALRDAKVTRHTAAPAGGEIVRDRRGEPTGVLKGPAIALVTARVPRATEAERARALRRAILEAHAHGITSVQDFSTAATDLDLYEEARKAGELTLRVYASVPVRTDDRAALDGLSKRFPDDPLLKTGLASVDAAQQDLPRMAAAINADNWQLAIDAPDAGRVAAALATLKGLAAASAGRAAERRHRIERVRVVADEDLAAFRALKPVASMQPLALIDDRLPDTGRRPAPDLMLFQWPMRTLQAAAVRLAFGSGGPALAMDPLASLAAAVAGTDSAPDETLTLKSAVNAWTSGPAWASFDEHRKGTLKPGMLADLVVLSTNVFDKPAASLGSAQVEFTIFDGKVVHRRRSAS